MSYTLVTSEQIIRKAGANASSVAIASTLLLADYADQAEAQVCEAVDFDLITNYGSVVTTLKPVIAKAVACLGAMDVIAYDPTGYLNSENQLILDELNNSYEKIIASLKNRQKKFDKFNS